MRCINCNNVIPEASTKCPYCQSKVDPNQKTAPVIDMGSVDDLNFNDKIDMMKNIKEPSNKKNVAVIAGIVCFLTFVAVMLLMMVFKGSGSNVNFYSALVNQVSDYLDEHFLGNNAIGTGEYTITYSIDGNANEFTGEYGYDTKNKIVSLTGSMRDPNLSSGGIVVDPKAFDFSLYLKNDSLYGTFDQLSSNMILFPIDDPTGLLATKNYEINSLIHGVLDALDEVAKKAPQTANGSTTIDYRGEKTSVKKKSIVLNDTNKKELYILFYKTLLDDPNFINEYARISGKKADEIKQFIQNEISTIEYKYSGTSKKETYVNVYYSGNKLYRFEIDRTKDLENDLLYIDIGETKYYVTYKKDNKKVFYFTVSVITKEVQDILNKTIQFEYEDSKNKKISFTLKLNENLKPTLKKPSIDKYKNIRDLSEEEVNEIKGNLEYYTKDQTLVDKIRETFKNKCTSELNCTCEDGNDVCKCVYGSGFITCPKTDIEPVPQEQ